MNNNIFEKYGKNPLTLFSDWMAEAETSEINDPNAMALATISPEGRPEVRIVLLKDADENGFTFFTNRESAKGQSLKAHPYAELNFHWKSLERQIRISGSIIETSNAESDAYFATRRRENRLGAWASNQSRELESYESFERRVAEMDKKFTGQDVPRPPYWGGYRVIPERMEFWIAHPARLHTRFVYVKENDKWTARWLFP